MRQKTVIKNLLQSVTKVYYKVRQVLHSVIDCYYKVRQVLQSASGITKYDRLLLQSASGITKCGSYYKVRCNTYLPTYRQHLRLKSGKFLLRLDLS